MPKFSLANTTRSSLRISHFRFAASSRLATQRARLYSSQPNKSKDEDTKKKDEIVGGKKETEASSKPAPGTENLYGGSKAPLSPEPK